MGGRTGPIAIRLRLQLKPTSAGGRSSPVAGRGIYRPHLRVDNSDLLGTGLWFLEPVPPGEEGVAVALLPYDVDYSPLRIGVDCEVFEGSNRVGAAFVLEQWHTALTLHHETHRLGVAVLELVDQSMGVWRGPFLPWTGYDRVRPSFRRFADASALSAPSSDARRRYYEERDSLGLRCSTWPAEEPADASWIHIRDFGDLDEMEVEVQNLSANPV